MGVLRPKKQIGEKKDIAEEKEFGDVTGMELEVLD